MQSQVLIQIGIFVIALGFLTVFFGSLIGADKEGTKFSVFGLIGFIPFGFANDKQLFLASLIITILFVLVAAVIFFRTL